MECNVEAVRSTQHSMTLSVDPRSRHSVFGISLRTSVELHTGGLASPVLRRSAMGVPDALQYWRLYGIPCRRIAVVGSKPIVPPATVMNRARGMHDTRTSPRRDQESVGVPRCVRGAGCGMADAAAVLAGGYGESISHRLKVTDGDVCG